MPTPVKTAAQLGRSNLSKGLRWMYATARWLRDRGFPGVEVIRQNGRADLGGLLEWTVECKNTLSDGLSAALDQVCRDQAARDTRWHVVLKKRQGKADPGEGFAVMTMRQWAEIARLLDELEA